MDTDIRRLSPEEKQRLAVVRYEEYRRITRWLIVGFALLIMLFWLWDWAVDPVHAPDTFWLRLMASGAALVALLSTEKRVGPEVSCILLYAVILVIQVIYTMILTLLSNGFLEGIGSYLYFLLASLLLGQPFPFLYNAVGCVLITLAPHLWGASMDSGFPQLLYMATIWPAGAAAILFHWGANRLIIDRLYYRRKMETLCMEDPLTGLLNRRALLRDYLRVHNLVMRERRELSIIMLDIDQFKKINDRYGHDAGDHVLSGLAEIMKHTFRASDSLARYGGEEFVCLLPDTGLSTAVDAGERLRQAVEQTPISIQVRRKETDISFTISLGITRAVPTETFDDLVRRADEALYRAKQGGRNRLEHIP